MTDSNKESDNDFNENQSDSCQKNTKKSSHNFIIRFFVYGLLLILVLTLFIYMNFPKIKDFIQKETPQKHNTFVKGPDMHHYHNGPAVLLDDGNVLVIGGDTKQAEIYDYNKNKFRITGNLNSLRLSGSTATVLKDGNVLIAGGYIDSNRIVNFKKGTVSYKNNIQQETELAEYAEIYDVAKESFYTVGKMCIPRMKHFAFPLKNGNVIFIGGIDNNYKNVKEIEEFDYKTKTFKIVGIFKDFKNSYYNSIILPNNSGLFLYGPKSNNTHSFRFIIYNPYNNYYKTIESKISHRAGTAVVSNENEIILTGGALGYTAANNSKSVSCINLKNDTIQSFKYELLKSRDSHSATILDDGTIILIGGFSESSTSGKILSDTEIIASNMGYSKENKAKLINPRYKHIAVKLKNGNILVLGGIIKEWNSKGTIEAKYVPTVKTELYFK